MLDSTLTILAAGFGDNFEFALDALLLLLVVIVGGAIVQSRNLFSAAILLGLYSLLLAIVWVDLAAMDVAFTEAAVGAGISTILLLGALVHTGNHERWRPTIHWPALLVVVVTGSALIYGTIDMPDYGAHGAPIHRHLMPEYVDQSVEKVGELPGRPDPKGAFKFDARAPQAGSTASDSSAPEHRHHHIPNLVTAILASYRGIDTLFETAVIFTAGLAMILLLSSLDRRWGPSRDAVETSSHPHARASDAKSAGQDAALEEQVVLRVIAKMMIPYVIVFGCSVVAHGEVGPGGGFQGGVILASAYILYALIFTRRAAERVFPRRAVEITLAAGVLMYAGVGVAGFFRGRAFLDYRALGSDMASGEALGMSLVEYGVALTVATAMITIYNMITEEADA